MSNEDKILAMLEAMQADLSGVKNDLADVKGDLTGVKNDLTGMKTDLAGVKMKLSELDEKSARSAIMLENKVLPQLQLLYENQTTIMDRLDTIPSTERVEALESDMSVIKDALKLLRQDVDALKKAQ